jgi:hypothetical protein
MKAMLGIKGDMSDARLLAAVNRTGHDFARSGHTNPARIPIGANAERYYPGQKLNVGG